MSNFVLFLRVLPIFLQKAQSNLFARLPESSASLKNLKKTADQNEMREHHQRLKVCRLTVLNATCNPAVVGNLVFCTFCAEEHNLTTQNPAFA